MKVAVFLADGFEEIEAITSIDVLRRAGVETLTLAVGELAVKGANGITVSADAKLNDELRTDFDMLLLPGGLPGAETLRDDPRVTDMVKRHFQADKHIAAICAAPIALGKAGVLDGRKATCYPSFEDQLRGATHLEDRVVVDGKIITSRGPGTSMEFALTVVEHLKGEVVANELRAGMLVK